MSAKKPFDQLGLAPVLLPVLSELGYEIPTPVQEQSIPLLMAGKDLLGQAQTGTGKTAAFALPILSHLDTANTKPQALIIAPTRELAIQVAEAFQRYAKHLKGFHVIPIYGGQDFRTQLKALKRGVHVIVATPGRVMDHLRRGTFTVDTLKTVVLDEADEMLKMGFIEDIEWILAQIPHAHQTALFSATMSAPIRKIAKRYLKDPSKIHIKPKESSVDTIEQFYIRVAKNQKLDVLTRFLEMEDTQAVLIFAGTRICSDELAEKLQARGYAAAALNGGMNQSLREKVLGRVKKGSLDIITATDVAARGIDVDRISHVINYDIPSSTESYIHRIGRTGRAGRKGKALLFVAPREQRLLNDIEHAMHRSIKQIEPPSLKAMGEKRGKELSEKVINIIAKSNKLAPHRDMVANIMRESDCCAEDIAAALAYLLQQSSSLPLDEIQAPEKKFKTHRKHSAHFKEKYSGRSDSKKKRSPNAFKKTSKKVKSRKTKFAHTSKR